MENRGLKRKWNDLNFICVPGALSAFSRISGFIQNRKPFWLPAFRQRKAKVPLSLCGRAHYFRNFEFVCGIPEFICGISDFFAE
jgi:hypothetical protein